LWMNMVETPKKINETETKLDDLAQSSIPYSIIERNDEEIRFYGIGDERTCPVPDTDGNRESPFSKYEFGDLAYWLKYCAYATLSSVLALPPNWGTGLPPPLPALPLPTVYIPIKAFQLAWGALVIGITITGIYPFPWVMIANMSTDYHVPLVDPATIIKKSADVIKKGLVKSLQEFKQNILQKAMDNVAKDVEFLTGEVIRIEDAQKSLVKPKRDRAGEAGFVKEYDPSTGKPLVKDNIGQRVDVATTRANAIKAHAEALAAYTITKVSLVEEKLTTKTKLFVAEQKWELLKSAQDGNEVEESTDPQVQAIKKSEEAIDKGFEKLDALLKSIEPFLKALPISVKGGSANFAFTLKNPKPIQEAGDDLNESVNEGLLAKISKPFELENSDFMSTNFGPKVNASYVNSKAYLNTLAASSVALIPKDPYPAYEMLVPWNLAWTLKFLLPSWAPTGGGQYGFPGFPKYPI
jgi:hypothetical protein